MRWCPHPEIPSIFRRNREGGWRHLYCKEAMPPGTSVPARAEKEFT